MNTAEEINKEVEKKSKIVYKSKLEMTLAGLLGVIAIVISIFYIIIAPIGSPTGITGGQFLMSFLTGFLAMETLQS